MPIEKQITGAPVKEVIQITNIEFDLNHNECILCYSVTSLRSDDSVSRKDTGRMRIPLTELMALSGASTVYEWLKSNLYSILQSKLQ